MPEKLNMAYLLTADLFAAYLGTTTRQRFNQIQEVNLISTASRPAILLVVPLE
jgi:hypothetical protein